MKCLVCRRRLAPALGEPKQTALQATRIVCAKCYGRKVTVRRAIREALPASTFYVSSLSWRGGDYVVKRFRRRMTCTCPEYVHRGQVLRTSCKHVRLVQLLARAAGGFRLLPRGQTFSFSIR